MKAISLIAAIVMTMGFFFEFAVIIETLAADEYEFTGIGDLYSPVYMLINGVLAAYFFISFSSQE